MKYNKFFVLIFFLIAFGMMANTALLSKSFVPVVSDYAFVYKEPSIRSKKVDEVLATQIVEILETSKISKSISLWIHIRSAIGITGWIHDYHLGFPWRFEKVSSIELKKFSSCAGDFCPEITFLKDGRYVYKYAPCYDGSCNPKTMSCDAGEIYEEQNNMCHGTGILYKFRKVFWLRHSGRPTMFYLVQTSAGKLCAPGFIACGDGTYLIDRFINILLSARLRNQTKSNIQ